MHTIDFNHYQQTRIQLIEQLEIGELDKAAFIKANHNLYRDRHVVEPKHIATFERGIFYYQYYNTMAKYHQLMYRELKYTDPFVAVEHRKTSDEHYQSKERITYRLLCDFDDEVIQAYFVKSQSNRLKDKLVEIVYTGREKVILHTVDQQVIKLLKQRQRLARGTQASKIDDYINTPYYSTK